MKTVVLGLDGASIDLILRWREELPGFKSLMQSSSWGTLESTVPPITMPAWASAATGKSPDSLGFFDFQVLDFKEKNSRIVKLGDWGKAVWDFMNDKGLSTAIVNYPGTFPPKAVNGLMISGFLSPSTKNVFYPRSLKTGLEKNDVQVKLYPETNPYLVSESSYYDDVIQISQSNIDLIRHILKKYDHDVYFFGLMMLDWIQHYFWKYLDPTHPGYEPESELKDAVKNGYKMIDRFIQELSETLDPDDNFLVFSDHGFGSLHGRFYINRFLSLRGFLKPRKEQRHSIRRALANSQFTRQILSFTNINIARIDHRLKFRRFFRHLLPKEVILDDPYTQMIKKLELNWEASKAFGYGYYNMIFVNTESRGGPVSRNEYNKVVASIISEINKECNENGRSLRAYKTNPEQRLNNPDIVYFIDEGLFTQSNVYPSKENWVPVSNKSGDHRLNGFWAFKSIKTKKNHRQDASILDLTPTLLKALDIKPEEGFDGKEINEIFAV